MKKSLRVIDRDWVIDNTDPTELFAREVADAATDKAAAAAEAFQLFAREVADGLTHGQLLVGDCIECGARVQNEKLVRCNTCEFEDIEKRREILEAKARSLQPEVLRERKREISFED